MHLHNHTQFSVLQSTISIAQLVKAAAQQKMPAVAMTDHANLMGAFHFVRDVLNHNKAAEAMDIKLYFWRRPKKDIIIWLKCLL